MIERTIYQCEHCNRKRLISKGAMKNHEAKCWWNLNNKTCVTCWHDNLSSCELKIKRTNDPKPNTHCKNWKNYEDVLEELNL